MDNARHDTPKPRGAEGAPAVISLQTRKDAKSGRTENEPLHRQRAPNGWILPKRLGFAFKGFARSLAANAGRDRLAASPEGIYRERAGRFLERKGGPKHVGQIASPSISVDDPAAAVSALHA